MTVMATHHFRHYLHKRLRMPPVPRSSCNLRVDMLLSGMPHENEVGLFDSIELIRLL